MTGRTLTGLNFLKIDKESKKRATVDFRDSLGVHVKHVEGLGEYVKNYNNDSRKVYLCLCHHHSTFKKKYKRLALKSPCKSKCKTPEKSGNP